MKTPLTDGYIERTYISNNITADTTNYFRDLDDYWQDEELMVDFHNMYLHKAINRVELIENAAKFLGVVINFNKDKVYFRCTVTSRNRFDVLTRIRMV